MEQVLMSHGAWMLGLFTLCGGIVGVKTCLWVGSLLCVVCVGNLLGLSLWLERKGREERWLEGEQPSTAMLLSPPSSLSKLE